MKADAKVVERAVALEWRRGLQVNEEKGTVMKAAYPKPGSTDENGPVPSFPEVGHPVPSHRTFRSSVKLTIRSVLTCVVLDTWKGGLLLRPHILNESKVMNGICLPMYVLSPFEALVPRSCYICAHL